MRFQKLTATGNDFLFIDAREGCKTQRSHRAEIAKKICDRHFGAGADGLVFVEKVVNSPRFRWDFYNSDGSSAEMCGNAARCMGRWLEYNLKIQEAEFETQAGLVRSRIVAAEPENSSAKLSGNSMSPALTEVESTFGYLALNQLVLQKISYKARGSEHVATLANTGVPHAVIEVANLEQREDFAEDIQALRFHKDSGERGCNVTFLERVSANFFKTATHERGVEGFTLSCGTGVLAAAVVGIGAIPAAHLAPVRVETPGGTLRVRFNNGPDQSAILQGPADLVYEGELLMRGDW